MLLPVLCENDASGSGWIVFYFHLFLFLAMQYLQLCNQPVVQAQPVCLHRLKSPHSTRSRLFPHRSVRTRLDQGDGIVTDDLGGDYIDLGSLSDSWQPLGLPGVSDYEQDEGPAQQLANCLILSSLEELSLTISTASLQLLQDITDVSNLWKYWPD